MTADGSTASLLASGRTLDDELSSLVARYGADAVRKAVKKATRKKRGRPTENDWPLLQPWIDQDVADWLTGNDPSELRSNYSIAKEFACEHPGHNSSATKDRIERKLREKRRWMMFAVAYPRTVKGHPFRLHLEAARGLAADDASPAWSIMFESELGKIAHYRERFGEPHELASMAEIEERLKAPANQSRRGLLGSGPFASRSSC